MASIAAAGWRHAALTIHVFTQTLNRTHGAAQADTCHEAQYHAGNGNRRAGRTDRVEGRRSLGDDADIGSVQAFLLAGLAGAQQERFIDRALGVGFALELAQRDTFAFGGTLLHFQARQLPGQILFQLHGALQLNLIGGDNAAQLASDFVARAVKFRLHRQAVGVSWTKAYGQPAGLMRKRQPSYGGPLEGAKRWLADYVAAGVSHFVLRFAGDHERHLDLLAGVGADLGR